MRDLTIIVNDAPYGIEKPWNALRLASTSIAEIGMSVNVFLMGDAVLAAKKGQKTPNGYYNMGKMLRSLVDRGANIKVCGACITARGIEEAELVDGIEKGTMRILATWVKESGQVVTF